MRQALDNEDRWFSLTITEKNTTGLLGSETGEGGGSNFHALMRHNNRSEKSQIGGGTFGKGSSVYTFSSGLWLWFAYSILKEKWETTSKRFIGRGMIAPFIEYSNCQSYEGPLGIAGQKVVLESIKDCHIQTRTQTAVHLISAYKFVMLMILEPHI